MEVDEHLRSTQLNLFIHGFWRHYKIFDQDFPVMVVQTYLKWGSFLFLYDLITNSFYQLFSDFCHLGRVVYVFVLFLIDITNSGPSSFPIKFAAAVTKLSA